MASWILGCKNCGRDFEHSKISDTLENFFFAPKPQLPPEGLEFKCPHCKSKAMYAPGDLKFQF